MTINEIRLALQKLVNANPEYGNLPAVYAADDEGNGFQVVGNEPTPGHGDELDGVYAVGEFFDIEEAKKEELPINCICIN